jgi:hypothetical protein
LEDYFLDLISNNLSKLNKDNIMKLFLLLFTICTQSIFAQISENKLHRSTNINDGLVAFYPFNGNANDESGNGNNPTYIGSGVTLTTDRFGNTDNAYYFDGDSGSYIRIPADSFPTTDRTISFWFNADQIENHPTPLSYGGDVCHNSVLMIINKGDYPNAYTVLSHCASNFISAPYSVAPVNNWYYLTMTISGVTQKIYINGELQQTANTFNTPTYVTGKSAILGAILYTDGNTVYDEPTAGEFQGKLDDFRFYNIALTDIEVQNLYYREANGLVAYYPFNANSNDSSGNNNNGINHNGVYSKDRYGNDQSSMFFNGVDSYVEGTNPGNNLPIGNSPRSFSAWINSLEYHQWGSNIFHYGTMQAAPTNFHFLITNVLGLGNGYGYGVVYGATGLNDSTWHFVSGVYEGGTERIVQLYVDGKLDTTGVISTEPNTILGTNWRIGLFMAGGTPFKGNIDEVKVYNTALSDQQIWESYKATTTAPNLIAPSNNSTLNTLMPGFYWDSLVTATSYKILLSTDSTFSTIIVEDSNITNFYLVADGLLSPDITYYWKVRTINDGGIGPWSEIYNFKILLTGVEDEQQLPTKFALMQNYPNPFNPTTVIKYQLPISSYVTIKVFDLLGREVAVLATEKKELGNHEVVWNADKYPSGIYIYRLSFRNFTESHKMLLVK